MFTMLQTNEMLKLREKVIRYNLEATPEFKEASLNTLLNVYNGCGPDWLPETVRDLLTRHYELFEPAFLVHDFDFTYLPKTEERFHEANNRLYDNCVRIVRAEIPVWRFIARYRRLAHCDQIYEACEHFGLGGYMEAKPK